jgi:hypothetical protein
MTHISKPILVSHQGKLVWLQPDGTKTHFEDGSPIVDPVEKPQVEPRKRWHDPY